jgi:hypothetical protein
MEVAMRRDRIWQWIVVALCMLVPVGCSKKTAEEAQKTPEQARETAERIDAGTFEGSMYRNKYLGFRLWIPPEWSIQDRQAQKDITDKGVQVVAGDNKNMQAALRAGEAQTLNLVMAFKHPRGAPVAFNPVIACTAELVSHLPGIRTGGDYLFHVKRLLEASQVKYSFVREVSMETMAGVEFYSMLTQAALSPQLVVNQDYYTTIRKGYAITLILSHATKEEAGELYHILETMAFAPVK